MANEIISFGKYKGRQIEEVLNADRPYAEWLVAQPWFREKHPTLVTIIVNGGPPSEDTPEHNQLQARFLDPKLQRAIYELVTRAELQGRGKLDVRFEQFGWDLMIGYSQIGVELKPAMGDDYPAVLRKTRLRFAYTRVVIVEHFEASVPWKQVVAIFGDVRLLSLGEVEERAYPDIYKDVRF